MAIEEVKAYFSEYGIEDRIREFDVSSATVELAAQALGCEPCRIAKTLSFMVDGKAILIVTSGDSKLHEKDKNFIETLAAERKSLPKNSASSGSIYEKEKDNLEKYKADPLPKDYKEKMIKAAEINVL